MTERTAARDKLHTAASLADVLEKDYSLAYGQTLFLSGHEWGLVVAALRSEIGEPNLIHGLKEAQKIIGTGNARSDWFSIEKRITEIDPKAGTYPAEGGAAVPLAPAPKTAKQEGHYIVTSFVYPPIPDRNFDWQATLRDYDGAPDSRGPCACIGRGPTETAAVAELLCQIDELESEKN